MRNSARPARQVCRLCSRDPIKVEAVAPGLWRYTCHNPRRHPDGPYTWLGTATEGSEPAMEGKAAELGLYEDLPKCLYPGEPFVEYGVVEHRYSELRPGIYQRLTDDYSHTRIERKHYTATVFIALALGKLAAQGELLCTFGTATGRWSYNEILSYWALPPGPPEGAVPLTWEEYAQSKGVDPSV